ncbi:MAG TPA: polysaccharide deacetylase family protein [Solirubrobacteraceae bacterium]|jgi:chitin deacetylase|nr:polysaccharide deacetylase family protein [Solirubrobacteraceae bacterium]
MRDGRILAALVLAGVLGFLLLTAAPAVDVSSGGPPIPTDPTGPATAGAGPGSPVVHAQPPPLSVREAAVAAAEHRAIDRVLAYTPYVSAGGDDQREIALTFDDGPSAYTQHLLGELRSLHVPATFFQIGYAISEFPRYAAREVEFGMAIGDHTLTHPFLANMSLASQRHEILGDADRIHAYGAAYPRLMRPPYESFNHLTTRVTRAAHMLMVLWSVDTADYTRPGVGRIVHTAVSGARPGAIILMHDGGGPRSETVAAVPRIVSALRRRHYRFVTVPRLMLDDPPPPPAKPKAKPEAKARPKRRTRPKPKPKARTTARSKTRRTAPARRGSRSKTKTPARSRRRAVVQASGRRPGRT